MKRLLALGLAAICLACALPLTACTPQQKLYSASWFDMFDTVTMVHGTPRPMPYTTIWSITTSCLTFTTTTTAW